MVDTPLVISSPVLLGTKLRRGSSPRDITVSGGYNVLVYSCMTESHAIRVKSHAILYEVSLG